MASGRKCGFCISDCCEPFRCIIDQNEVEILPAQKKEGPPNLEKPNYDYSHASAYPQKLKSYTLQQTHHINTISSTQRKSYRFVGARDKLSSQSMLLNSHRCHKNTSQRSTRGVDFTSGVQSTRR